MQARLRFGSAVAVFAAMVLLAVPTSAQAGKKNDFFNFSMSGASGDPWPRIP
jgi:hypothetical protein